MFHLFNLIMQHKADIKTALGAISEIIAGASVLANFTKSDTDNQYLRAAQNVVHGLALNLDKIKPLDPAKLND